jgi:hypothetical protein
MKRPLFAGSARKRLFWRSAVASMPNPATQTSAPTTVTTPIASRAVVVIAASAAARVRLTHSPCSVQALRKRTNDGLIRSKRSSLPALRMRRKR